MFEGAMNKFIAVLIIASLFFTAGCQKEKHITGYDTKVVFIADDESSYKDINDETKQGWEIKSTRRAWKYGGFDGLQHVWGTEYTLQKAMYDDD